jgi:ribosomal protein S18 acetylase RimI-like enzyme
MVTIQKATSVDVPAMRFAHDFEDPRGEVSQSTFEVWMARGGAFVALDGVRVVGQVFHQCRDEDNTCYLLMLHVDPGYRRHGIGTRLITRVIELARDHGDAGVTLSVDNRNPRARALYERLGFKEYAADATDTYMVLWLAVSQVEDQQPPSLVVG